MQNDLSCNRRRSHAERAMDSLGILVTIAALALSTTGLRAQTISGVSDQAEYTGSVTFTVEAEAGFDLTATLNGDPVPVGEPYRVERMDFYELAATRTPTGGGSTTENVVRFIVLSPDRGTPERGLIEWTPYPLVPSADAEFDGARLDLMLPRGFPQGIPIPVVAWVRDASNDEVRVNGSVTAPGFEGHAVRVFRGAGSGFLPPAETGGTNHFQAGLGTLSSGKEVRIDHATTWTSLSGTLSGTNTWSENARIRLAGDITIPTGSSLEIAPGTVVLIEPGVNITSDGPIVINGTVERPVVLTATGPVLPELHANAWGGFILDGAGAALTATGTIMVGGGGATRWDFSPGASHRSEQAVILAHHGAVVSLTDSAVINTAGQVGNGYQSDVTFVRTLLQRAITAGEYVGGTIILDHAALIEFPEDNGEVNAKIAADDYDGIYFTTGTHIIRDSLIGFCKDDAIDSGSGGPGTVEVRNSWLESALHEAMAWSGEGRQTETYDTVVINNGQGIECGWGSSAGSPDCYGTRMLLTANSVGARFGDNYTWGYSGRLEVEDSLVLHNYRDVWGYNWDDWTYRVAQMDIHGNRLTETSSWHVANVSWDPLPDAPLLAPFMATPATADVGIGIATWNRQGVLTGTEPGVPVRLSSFTTRPVSVGYRVQDASAAVLDRGTLVFAPGETVKHIAVGVPAPANGDLLRVSLHQPVNGQLTGETSYYLIDSEGGGDPAEVDLIARGAVWEYYDQEAAPGAGWSTGGDDGAGWGEGPAELGAGDGGEATVIDIGPDGGRWPTVYFRKAITLPDPVPFVSLRFGLRRDDGAVIYVNGVKVYRDDNVPEDAGHATYATGLTPSETAYHPVTVEASVLVPGTNVVAVEVHQQSATSSDLSFDLALTGIRAPEVRMIDFGSDLSLIWFDDAYGLEHADQLTGPWNPVTGDSPVGWNPETEQAFFRLRGP